DRPQRARLEVLALQVALLLERAQVIVHAVRRFDTEVQADLAERRRVAALADGLRDEGEDLALAIRQDPARVVANQRQRAHVVPPPVCTEHTYRTEQMCRVNKSVQKGRPKRAGDSGISIKRDRLDAGPATVRRMRRAYLGLIAGILIGCAGSEPGGASGAAGASGTTGAAGGSGSAGSTGHGGTGDATGSA